MKRLAYLILTAVILPFAPLATAAEIEGVVKDITGAVLPRAFVQVMDSFDRPVASTIAGSRGEFRLRGLAAGSYKVFAELPGFRASKIEEIEIEEGKIKRLELRLEVAPLEETIVITATRTETPAALVGSSVTVISGEEMRRQGATSVAEVLRNVPGISVVQRGGRGGLTTLFVRGGNSNFNKVLIDGVPVNEPGGFFDFSSLSTANIERVEIVRGPQSALFGSDAMSSVIQIFTRRGTSEDGGLGFSYSAEGGSFDTFRQAVAIAGAGDRADYALSFSRLDTDNAEVNSFFHNVSSSGNIGLKLSEAARLRFTFRSEGARGGTPGQTAFHRPDRDAYFRRRDLYSTVMFEHRTSASWRQQFSYTFSTLQRLNDNPIDSGPFVPRFGERTGFPSFDFLFRSLNLTRRHRLSYQSDFAIAAANIVSAGFEYEEELGAIGSVRARRTNLGYFVQDQVALGNRFFAAAGVRLEDNGSFGFAASPRVSLAYFLRKPAPRSRLGSARAKFNFGLGIKEPGFVESFSKSPFFRGNPELKPERARSFDFGLEQTLFGDRAKIDLTFFDNRYRDLIAFAIVDFNTFEGSFFNIGRSRARGIELSAQAAPGFGLTAAGGYTLLDSRVLKSTSPFSPVLREGQRLLLRPVHSGFLNISWTRGRLSLSANSTFVGRRTDSDFLGLGLTRNEGYTKLDLSGSFRFSANFTFFAAIENLLNQEYFEALGFPALKLNFRAGGTFRF